MNKVSVIIPVYNVEKYLQRCVTSVTEQSYSNLEIILVDDGSVDKSGAICDDFAKKDKRIRVIHKENEGLGLTRNVGIKVATGNYICFIDSDDYIAREYIETIYSDLKKSSADVCYCGHTKGYKWKIRDKKEPISR